jgi:imidazolonepropionase-like amidohydrolase
MPVRNLGGRLVTPALIDCHTHVLHGGNRAAEFETRLQGASYKEVARAGGGIVPTVACTLFRMIPGKALAGATTHAARALGLTDRGTLAVGQIADLAVWNCGHPAELAYRIGFNPLHQRIIGGVL